MIKAKIGSALIWILVLIVVVIVAVFFVYSFSKDSKGIIREAYFDEFSYEICELNFVSSGANSKEDCYNSQECMADSFVELIEEDELDGLAKYMEENGGEDGFIYYSQKHPEIMEKLNNQRIKCS